MTHPTHEAGGTIPEVPALSTIASLGLGSIVMVAFMLLHPTVHDHEADVVQQLADLAGESATVHGLLVASMLLVLHGLVGFAPVLGWRLARVRAGTIAQSFGVVCFAIAAMMNGFVVPELAVHHLGRDAADGEGLHRLFLLCHLVGGAFARTGVVATSAAIASWSCVLLRRDSFARALGGLGLLVGAVSFVGLLAGHLHLDVHGMGFVVVAQALWNIGVAAWLLRLRR